MGHVPKYESRLLTKGVKRTGKIRRMGRLQRLVKFVRVVNDRSLSRDGGVTGAGPRRGGRPQRSAGGGGDIPHRVTATCCFPLMVRLVTEQNQRNARNFAVQ
jgi:hypothetical protein